MTIKHLLHSIRIYSMSDNHDIYDVINIDYKQVKIYFFDIMMVKKSIAGQNKFANGRIINSV